MRTQIRSTPTGSTKELAKTIRLSLRLFDKTFNLLNRLRSTGQALAQIERDRQTSVIESDEVKHHAEAKFNDMPRPSLKDVCLNFHAISPHRDRL